MELNIYRVIQVTAEQFVLINLKNQLNDKMIYNERHGILGFIKDMYIKKKITSNKLIRYQFKKIENQI